MTTDRDFDRLARAWLDLMPDEAPDRTVAAVLQAVETTPQVRRPIRWLTWRSSTMNRVPIALGAAAVVVVAGTLLLSRSGTPPTAGASASPVATIAPTASAVSPSGSGITAGPPLPSELLARWMGDHRQIIPTVAGASMVLAANSLVVTESNGSSPVLTSTASSLGAGRMRLESATAKYGCQAGDVGIYGWTLSATSQTLTVSTERDDCAPRADTVSGVWWLMGCKAPDDLCLGAIDAGTYGSQFLAPRLDPGGAWVPNFGGLSYRVPDGWANAGDWPGTFTLLPSAEYPGAEGIDTLHSIEIASQPTAISQALPCSTDAEPGVGRSVDKLIAWLRHVPGLATSAPTAITLDGHPGRSIDLRIDPAWTRGCGGGPQPIITYFEPFLGIVGGERQRLILLDLGAGDVVAIVIRTSDPADFASFLAGSTPIVQSFKFE